MTTRITLGSISHGTMRPEDLIPVFEAVLKGYGEPLPHRGIYVHNFLAGKKLRGRDREKVSWYLEELVERLELLAPPYCYFGAHVGYGYWVDHDAIEEARESGELEAGEDWPDEVVGKGYLFLHISDHGNMELYRWSGSEWVSLWSLV
jgi:hypothetical protein